MEKGLLKVWFVLSGFGLCVICTWFITLVIFLDLDVCLVMGGDTLCCD